MKIYKLAVFTFLILTISNGYAQLNEANQLNPYIEVIGTAEMEIVPNEIYIGFTLKDRMDGKAKVAIEEQEREMKMQLKNAGIDLDNLNLSDASAEFISIKRKNKEVLTSKDYLLKVATVKDVAAVFEVLDKVQALNGNITRVAHSKIEKYRKDVKIEAIKQAKEKAGYLLEAIGEKAGKPLIVQERESYDDIRPMMIRGKAAGVAAEYEAANETEPEISFQKIKLKYAVFVRFAIE